MDNFFLMCDLPFGTYGLIAAVIIAVVRYFFFDRPDEQEAEAVVKKNYQREVKRVISEREKREIGDFLMPEEAFYIISNSTAFHSFDHFQEWLLSKGQVYFNNYIENPEWIANARFEGLDGEGIYNALAETYFAKTSKLLPEVEDYQPELRGEKIDERQVADMFPKLWEKFLVN